MVVEQEPMVPEKRQTLSYLRELFQKRGLQPKNKLGQNFLIDLNILDVIVREAELSPDDLLIEIGTGTGSLTARLAGQAKAVFSVEIDSCFFELARENLGQRSNLHLLHADILRNKNQLNPEVWGQFEQARGDFPGSTWKLVSNLPYAVATPVIANFLLTDFPLERMVVTVQLEIAERLLASPGTKAFGALGVLVQSLADVELVRRLQPAVFWPRPQVASAIVRIRPNPAKRGLIPDVRRFRNFLRDLYSHRRKNLRGALASFPGRRLGKDQIDGKLLKLGLDGTIRAETLNVEQHLLLCREFG